MRRNGNGVENDVVGVSLSLPCISFSRSLIGIAEVGDSRIGKISKSRKSEVECIRFLAGEIARSKDNLIGSILIGQRLEDMVNDGLVGFLSVSEIPLVVLNLVSSRDDGVCCDVVNLLDITI